jgi:hypothetical protein
MSSTSEVRLLANIQQASTEDLLDRVTVWRAGMDPSAVERIEQELRRRGVGEQEQEAHAARHKEVVVGADGLPLKCQKCSRPAVGQRWGWHRLWGVVPLFPRKIAFCEEHAGRRED